MTLADELLQNVKLSQSALADLSTALNKTMAKKSNGGNGKSVNAWFDLVKLRDSVNQMVADLLDVDKVLADERDVDTDKRD
jgi:hypothetical protein